MHAKLYCYQDQFDTNKYANGILCVVFWLHILCSQAPASRLLVNWIFLILTVISLRIAELGYHILNGGSACIRKYIVSEGLRLWRARENEKK